MMSDDDITKEVNLLYVQANSFTVGFADLLRQAFAIFLLRNANQLGH